MLAARPASGKWSVVENVRHLPFAEQSHLGQFAPGGRVWSPPGLPPAGRQGQKQLQVADTAGADCSEVLGAWAVAHAEVRAGLEQQMEQAEKALDRNPRHLRAHLRVIERLLRQPRRR